MLKKCWFLLSLQFDDDDDDDHHHHHHHPVITFLNPAPFDSLLPSLHETLCSLGSWDTTHASSPGCFLLGAPPSFSWTSYMLWSPIHSPLFFSFVSDVIQSYYSNYPPHADGNSCFQMSNHLSSPGPHRFQRYPCGCPLCVSIW